MEKWPENYPNAMKRREHNWNVITPICWFSAGISIVSYTTNVIESMNATTRQRSVFPCDKVLLKALYLAAFEVTKKWSLPIRSKEQVYGEQVIMNEVRRTDY